MIEPTTRIIWTNRLCSRAALWAFSLFLFLVATITGLWFAGATMVRENIIAMATDLAADGGHFSAKTMKITGFPTAFEVHLTGIRLAGSGPRGPWDWQAEKIRAQLAPWQTSNIRFDLAGTHRVRVHAARMPLDLAAQLANLPAFGFAQLFTRQRFRLIRRVIACSRYFRLFRVLPIGWAAT